LYNLNFEQEYKSNIFGIFDPITMGLTLENLSELEKAVKKEQEEIIRIGQSYPGRYENALFEHQKKFHFYYRVRAHERAHWYTSISSSITISRLFSDGDTFTNLTNAMQDYLLSSHDKIIIPLGKWAQTSDCPEKLSKAVLTYNLDKYINSAIDGILLKEHLFDSNKFHILNAYFPDLESFGDYWNSNVYKIGVKALIEGAGKAAEWLYFLRKDNSYENEAWDDIKNAQSIYNVALKQLIEVIPGLALLDYLQILCVLIDFSLNPYIYTKSWPFLWGEGNAKDLIPSFRFQQLINLLSKNSIQKPFTKDNIASLLTKYVQEELGWQSHKSVSHQLLKLVKSGMMPGVEDTNLWNPLETIEKALTIKTVDPMAYVPPVNSDMINTSGTYPQIELTVGVANGPDTNILLVYILRSLQTGFLNDIVNIGSFRCPLIYNPWMAQLARLKGLCKLGDSCYDRNLNKSINWYELRKCDFYESILTYFFERGIDRIKFL